MAQNTRPTLAQRTRASVSQRAGKTLASDENVAPSLNAAGKSILAGGAQRVRVPLGQKILADAGASTSVVGGVKAGVLGRKALNDLSNKERLPKNASENGKKDREILKEGRPRSSTINGAGRVPLRPVSNVLPQTRSARTSVIESKTEVPTAPRPVTLPLPGPYAESIQLVLQQEEYARNALVTLEPAEEDLMDLDDEMSTAVEIVTSLSVPMLPIDAFESSTPPVPSSDPEEARERDVVARQLSPASTSPVVAHREELSDDDLEDEDGSTEDWVTLPSREHRKVMAELDRVRKIIEEEIDPLDTTMVAEYTDDIFEYMNELEASVMPSPNYMNAQSEIEWSMRTTLVDWLLQVHLRYHMLPETLWIAVNVVDRFLSARVVSLVKLQLVGVTAMFVAAKYEEILAPSVDEFVFMTENGYTKEEILKGERIILQTLDFKISNYCSPYSWVRRISKADDYDIHTRTLCKFLMEVTLLDERFLRAKPSMIAAIGMYVARRMLGGDWDDLFMFYSSYTEQQLIPGAKFIVERLVATEFEGYYVCKKYATKRFLKASVFARDWAKKHGREIERLAGNGSNKDVLDGDAEVTRKLGAA